MAEASEHSPGAAAPASPPGTTNIQPAGPAGSAPAFPGVPGHEQETAYQPLSLLAVAGLILAVGYSVLVNLGGLYSFAFDHPRWLVAIIVVVALATAIAASAAGVSEWQRVLRWVGIAELIALALVGLGSLVAFSGTKPWVLPFWTILIPIATAGLCWMARVRIQSSEGTLAGLEFTSWGLGLCLFFGLNYTAYLASNYFAVRLDASRVAQTWLELIRDGELEKAFLLTLPVSARPDENDPKLRDLVEVQYNRIRSPVDVGVFSRFCRSAFARQIQLGGMATRFELVRAAPRYERGTYQVDLEYKVSTPYAQFNLVIPTQGTESVGSSGTGREWQVLGEQVHSTAFTQTAEGQARLDTTAAATGTLIRFRDALKREDFDTAWLMTQPPQQRKTLEKKLKWIRETQAKGLEGVAEVNRDAEAGKILTGIKEFQAGSLIHDHEGKFWADKRFRDQIVQDLKELFQPGSAKKMDLNLSMDLPQWKTTGEGQVRLLFPVVIPIHEPNGRPTWVVEANLGVESPEDRLASEGGWVASLGLLRGNSSREVDSKGPGGPGGPGPK
jgi:hypothetical protein